MSSCHNSHVLYFVNFQFRVFFLHVFSMPALCKYPMLERSRWEVTVNFTACQLELCFPRTEPFGGALNFCFTHVRQAKIEKPGCLARAWLSNYTGNETNCREWVLSFSLDALHYASVSFALISILNYIQHCDLWIVNFTFLQYI